MDLLQEVKRVAKQANERLRKMEKKHGKELAFSKSFAYQTVQKIVGFGKNARFSTSKDSDKELQKRLFQMEKFLSEESSTLSGLQAQEDRRMEGLIKKALLTPADEDYINEGKTKKEQQKRKKQVYQEYKESVDWSGLWTEFDKQIANLLMPGNEYPSEQLLNEIERYRLYGATSGTEWEWIKSYVTRPSDEWRARQESWEEYDEMWTNWGENEW